MNERIAVHIHGWGTVSHPKGDFLVDRKYFEEMKAAHEHIQQWKHPPVLREHERDGLGWGKIETVFTDDDPPDLPWVHDPGFGEEANPGIWCAVQPSKPLLEMFRDSLIVDWSPRVKREFTCRHTGKTLKNFLREVSFVSMGHQYNTDTPAPAYALSDGFIPLSDNNEEAEMARDKDDESMEAADTGEVEAQDDDAIETLAGQVGQLADQLQAIDERLQSLEDDGEEAESADDRGSEDGAGGDDEAEMSDALFDRVAELEDRLAEERRLRIQQEARSELAERDIELTDTERDSLVETAVDQPEVFETTVDILEKKQEEVRKLSDSDGQQRDESAFREAGACGSPETGTGLKSQVIKLSDEIDEEDPHAARRQARRRLDVDWTDARQSKRGKQLLDEHFPTG